MFIDRVTLYNYLGFICGMGILLLLPSEGTRLVYLHGVSTVSWYFANDTLRMYILLAMFHSAVHNLWPFLTAAGFDPTYESVYDVFCHFTMMFACFQLINQKITNKKKIMNILSIVFLIGSLVNCYNSYYMDNNKDSFNTILFVYTSIFQAISTGYWVVTLLWYNRLNNPQFFYHWILAIILYMFNWGIYKYSEDFIALSMFYRYVEGVFMVCSWMPLLF